MGTVTSNHTRRISFDNTSAFNSALALQTIIEDEHHDIDFEKLPTMPAHQKVSQRQLELLLSLAETNPSIGLGSFPSGYQSNQALRRLWESSALDLNAVADGVTKTPEQWRRVNEDEPLPFINKYVDENKQQGNGDYWSSRVENLKKEHQIINQIIETEYEKKIESVNSIYDLPKVTHEKILKLNPCLQMRTKMIQCYSENSKQPLNCSEFVQAFNNCVASCKYED